MTVNVDQIKKGVQSYYENEFCQKASGVDKFAAYFMLPSVPMLVQNKLEQFRATPYSVGMIDADGLVDLDSVRDRAISAMQHCGSLEVMGFRLGESDVDKLYEAIRRS